MSAIVHWFKKTLLRENRCYGVYASISSSGKSYFDVVLLQRKRDQISIEGQWLGIDSIEALGGIIQQALPVILNCDIKGILHKKVSGLSDIEPDALLSKLLPNTSIQDFYIQQKDINNTEQLVSIARKEAIDGLIDQINAQGIKIVGLAIGINCILGFEILLKTRNLQLPNWTIEFDEHGMFKEFSRSQNSESTPCNVAGSVIDTSLLLPYFSAVQYFTELYRHVAQPEMLDKSDEEFTYKQLLKKGLIAIVSLLLFILLSNYLVFDFYYKKRLSLEDKLSSSVVLLQMQKELKIELEKKQSLIVNQGFDSETKNAYYADRIAYSIPSGIMLEELRCFVPKEEPQGKGKQEFVKSILSSGTVSSSVVLNDWIIRLKNESWIDSVQIISYAQKENQALFTVKLSLKAQ